MATRVTDGARRERHSLSSRAAALVSRVSRLRRSRACTPLTKSEAERETTHSLPSWLRSLLVMYVDVL